MIDVPVPGDPGGGEDGGGTTPISDSGPRKCTSQGKTIPCENDGETWYDAIGCYLSLQDPQPPKSNGAWRGHNEGAIFWCRDINNSFGALTVWLAAAPDAPPPPDPEVLARQAIATMNLRAVGIGIVPEPTANSVGIIGMPTWMWVDDPGQSTTGPITRSATERGYTVTATATVDRIVWTMGDGSSVTCHGKGIAYSDGFGKRSSPTCGHTYTRTGRYAVTATSYWQVDWAGIGQAGTIPLDFERTAQITMGESQVIVR